LEAILDKKSQSLLHKDLLLQEKLAIAQKLEEQVSDALLLQKENAARSCWPHPPDSGPRGRRPCLVRLGVEPPELSEIAVNRGVFLVLLGLQIPRSSPEKKGVTE